MRRALPICILYIYCISYMYEIMESCGKRRMWLHPFRMYHVPSGRHWHCRTFKLMTGGESQEKASRKKGWGHAKLLFLQKQLDTVCWIGSNDIKADIHFQERLAFPCCRSFISRWDKPDKIKALTLGTPNKCKATMKQRTILKHVGWCRSIDVRS